MLTSYNMYAKLFGRITESSLMEEDIEVRYVFLMLLAIADATGHVIGTDTAIARRINVPAETFSAAIKALQQPDESSNSKEREGRRVVPSDSERGYFLVNYLTYRNIKNVEGRRAYMRAYMQRRRESDANKRPVNSRKQRLAQEEEEVEVEVEAEVPTTCTAGAVRVEATKASPADEVFEHYRTYHPRARVLGGDERKKIIARLKEGFTVDDLKAAIDGQHRSPHHLGKNPDGRQYLSLELAVRDSSKVNQFLAVPASSSTDSVINRVISLMEEGNGKV